MTPASLRARMLQGLYPLYRRFLRRPVARLFFMDLVGATQNFGTVTWLGHPIWQNVLDLWTIQEVLATVRPDLLIECGTNHGGAAFFYAHLFDLMGKGEVVSIDVERMHDRRHPRVTFLIGSSTSAEILAQARTAAQRVGGPVFVILDSPRGSGARGLRSTGDPWQLSARAGRSHRYAARLRPRPTGSTASHLCIPSRAPGVRGRPRKERAVPHHAPSVRVASPTGDGRA